MLVYFACSPSKKHISLLAEEDVNNVLFSYHFVKKADELMRLLNGYAPEHMIIDSGAFSVWSNGGTIDIDDYAKFCLDMQKALPNIDLNITNLDVLPGKWGFVPSQEQIDASAEKGWQNMLYLESKGLKVIHVFHQHERFEVLDRLVEHSDYIGISPANDVSQKEKSAWMAQVYKRIRNKVRTHGFAVTSHRQLYKYPYYSADSSSWITPARYGRIPVMTHNHQIKTFTYKSQDDVERYWEYVSHLGIDDLNHPTSWEGRTRIAIATYKKLGEVATEIWDRRGITW